MENSLFRSEARERLVAINPSHGAKQFEKINAFTRIALDYPDTPLVVPPGIDQDLHEILCARDDKGEGFETRYISHVVLPALGETVGKSLRELDSPVAKKTITILENRGYVLDDGKYQAPACILKVLS